MKKALAILTFFAAVLGTLGYIYIKQSGMQIIIVTGSGTRVYGNVDGSHINEASLSPTPDVSPTPDSRPSTTTPNAPTVNQRPTLQSAPQTAVTSSDKGLTGKPNSSQTAVGSTHASTGGEQVASVGRDGSGQHYRGYGRGLYRTRVRTVIKYIRVPDPYQCQ